MNKPQPSIFITGAGSGIGAASARRFAKAGWRVGLSDVDPAKVAALAAGLGDNATAHPADVRDSGQLRSAIEAFCGPSQRLDVLFNCAGILDMQLFASASLDRLHAVMDVNVIGVINGCHVALPHLRNSGNARIVTMSSLAAVYGVPEEAAYSASKFAVRGLTEALNIEFEADGIWVCDLMVGYVATPMVIEAEVQARSVELAGVNVTAEQVAETVWQAATGEHKVHWFVNDHAVGTAEAFDRLDWDSRREAMKRGAGF